MEFTTLIWLFPLIFMLHDFEEIIMMQAWQNKNKDYLLTRFPRIGKRIIGTYENLSTASFSIAVLEEFLILSIAAVLAAEFDNFLLWTASFLAFFMHLFIHIIQWIIIRRYLPAIVSTFLALPYCIYAFNELIYRSLYSYSELALLFLAGLILLVTNLLMVHKLAAFFEKWLKSYAKP
ncbi:MAG: HXXEE domain-containing protein [Bacteroidales bacterium]|nr:HXXEE domain-containing protein [Bacteroidales bacterium]